MSGAAISGFVDGLFRGIGVRHSWDDRKREIERQKRADAIRDSAEARAQQEHDRRMKVYDQGTSDWERARADSDFYRSAYEDAAAATDASFGAMPQGEAPAGKPNEAPEQPDLSPAHGVAMELGIDPRVVRPNRSAEMMTRLSPADKLQAQADAQPVTPKRAGSAPSIDRRAQFEPRADLAPRQQPTYDTTHDAVRTMGAGAVGYGTGQVDPRLASAAGMPGRPPQSSPQPQSQPDVRPQQRPSRITFLPDGTAVMPAPSSAIADEIASVRGGPVGPNFVPPERLYTAPQDAARSRPGPGMTVDDLLAASAAAQGPSAASKRALEARPDRTRAIEKSAAAFAPPDTRTKGQRISDIMGPVRHVAVGSAAKTLDRTVGALTGMGAEAYGALQQGAGYVAGAFGAPETADMLIGAGDANRQQARTAATEGWSKAYLGGQEGSAPDAAPSVQTTSAKPEAPAATPPAHIPMKAAATPQEKQDAAAAVEVLDKTATPAAKDATVAATQAMGVKPQQKTVTDAQYKRGGEAWMKRYIEVGAPKVLEALISRGEFEKAKTFQEFMQSTSTKTAMKDLGVASAAFLMGDADKGASHMMKVFNNLGYFPDGTQVVEDETDFTRDTDGNINGLKMTFRDADSGNTWEMVETGDVTSLMTKLVPMVMPENAFEFYWKQQEAATASATGAAAAAKADQARIDKLAADIFKQSADVTSARVDKDGKPLPPMTIDEAYAEAERVILGQQTGGAPAPQVPPAAYRPK